VDAFYIGNYEVQWSEWQSVLTWALAHGYAISVGAGRGAEYPVTNVNWYDVLKWCNARSEQEGLAPVYTVGGAPYRTGEVVPDVSASTRGYRLPSEKEWEFAARGGVSTHSYTYSGSNDINAVAWYQNISGGATHPLGTKLGNELGLFDLSGNVWEWCFDVYSGSYRVVRGGSWGYDAFYCRVSFRYYSDPGDRNGYVGFRVARSAAP
jgi:formylglycine-generating enzyme required for sulfatase activity